MIHSDGEFANRRPPPFKSTRFGYPVDVIVSPYWFPPLRGWSITSRGRVVQRTKRILTPACAKMRSGDCPALLARPQLALQRARLISLAQNAGIKLEFGSFIVSRANGLNNRTIMSRNAHVKG